MTQTTKIEGMDGFIRDLGKLSAAARSAKTMDALEAGARVIQVHAQNNARSQLNRHPTGNLVNSIDVRREGKQVLVGVFGVVYAKIQEFGGIITPKKAKALFFIDSDGFWNTVKSVHMPARPYLRPAVDGHMPEIQEAVAEALRELLRKAI